MSVLDISVVFVISNVPTEAASVLQVLHVLSRINSGRLYASNNQVLELPNNVSASKEAAY
jgi:hypothetical protein